MTSVEIANLALSLVCTQRIVTLDDTSVQALRVREFLPVAITEVLSAFAFRCARRRVALVELAEKPAFGWAHQFQLPHDYLRAVELNGCPLEADEVPRFVVEADRLLTDVAQAHLVYVADPSKDTTGAQIGRLDALCCAAIYTHLAELLAYPLTESLPVQQVCAAKYRAAMDAAKKKSNLEAQEPRKPFYEGQSVSVVRAGGVPFSR